MDRVDKILATFIVLIILATIIALVLNVHPFETPLEIYQIGIG